MVHYGTALQNATEILTKSTTILLQNAKTVYYKRRQLLQNATVITKCDCTLFKHCMKTDQYVKIKQIKEELKTLKCYYIFVTLNFMLFIFTSLII